jgi:hypothetical protein
LLSHPFAFADLLVSVRLCIRVENENPGLKERWAVPEITPDLIFQVASGFMAANLFVANEVGLFEKLGFWG